MRTLLPFPAMIVPDAKCRIGITMDPVGREAMYRDDWPHAGRFMLVRSTPSSRQDAAILAGDFAKLCGCEYDYLPDERTPFGDWYVYHFMQGGRGIRALF